MLTKLRVEDCAGREFELFDVDEDLAVGVILLQVLVSAGEHPTRPSLFGVERDRQGGVQRLVLSESIVSAGVRSGDRLRICPAADTDCLRALYLSGGAFWRDALVAGLPERSVPPHLETELCVRRVLEELARANRLHALFVLAALQWPNDLRLRCSLAQLALRSGSPEKAAPEVWCSLRRTDQEKLNAVWSDVRRHFRL